MAQYFDGSYTYTVPETKIVQSTTYNDDGSITVSFQASPDLDYTYTVTSTDAYGDVTIHEQFPEDPYGDGNYSHGIVTGYHNGGDFTVEINENGNHYTRLFLSAPESQGGSVTLYPDERGGNFEPPVCFAAGTHILTMRGDVAVETLKAGDLVVTASGDPRPIRWIGHRRTACRNHPRPHEVMPVRIAAHAFGPNKPARDLYMSPGHSICLDVVGEVLIPAIALVNGATIAQVEVDEITYWHVELDSHDVILAENLPAESYLDMGNRAFFAENDVVVLDAALDALPDADPAVRTHADYCRPFHLHGPLVEAVRAQMRARALALGWRLSTALDAHLEVDGRRVDPVVRDGAMRFLVPAGASDVWLVSPAVRPCDINGSSDARTLGIDLRALKIDDGFAPPRAIAIDDPRLDAGFSHIEDGHRWTAGRARLPADLWQGCADAFFLRVDLGVDPVARWVAPGVVAGVAEVRAA